MLKLLPVHSLERMPLCGGKDAHLLALKSKKNILENQTVDPGTLESDGRVLLKQYYKTTLVRRKNHYHRHAYFAPPLADWHAPPSHHPRRDSTYTV